MRFALLLILLNGVAAAQQLSEFKVRGDILYRPESAFTSSVPTRLWTNNTVPYEIDPTIPNQQRIADAVQFYNQNTPVKYQPHAGEVNYVTFKRTTIGDGTCYSSIGMVGGQQFVMTDDGCGTPTLIHEMGHTVGFIHEQERQDRNQHITVLYENIDKAQFGEFPIATGEQDVAAYEWASLMHYSQFEFSRNAQPVMQTVPAGIPLVSYSVLSPGDLDTLFRMYGATPTSTKVVTNPPGLSLMVDGATVTTPQTYNWAAGSTHTVAANTQALTNGRAIFAAWSDRGAAEHTITASPSVTLYTANFIQQVQITTSAAPVNSGTVTLDVASPDGFYARGTTVHMTAVPASGYQFLRWQPASGGACIFNTASPANLNVAATTLSCAAVFTQSPITVVTSDPAGRTVTVDGTNYASPVSFAWTPGSSHTIAASTPASTSTSPQRYLFQGWSDGGAASHSVTAGPNGGTLTATFKTQYLLVLPSFNASVTTFNVTPSASDNFYDAGTSVRIEAVPAAGVAFQQWTRDLAGQPNPATITMNDQEAFNAIFYRPSLPPLTVYNAGSFLTGAVSPGEVVTIYGSGIGPAQLTGAALDSSGRVATTVAGAQVLFDGIAAPIVYVSSNQASVVVPYGISGHSTTNVTARYNGQTIGPVTLAVTATSPSVFTSNSSGSGNAAAVNQDGSINSPTNPAAKGSVVVFYATGEGQLNPGGTDGVITGAKPAAPALPVSLRIGGKPAQLLYAAEAPSLVSGVLQVNAVVPDDAPSGSNVSVYLVVGNNASPTGVTIAVR